MGYFHYFYRRNQWYYPDFYESEKCETLSNRVTEVLQIKKKNKKSILSILLGTPGASLLNFTSFLAAKVIIRPGESIIRAGKNL